MHKISQTDAPAAVPTHERTAAEARFIARVLAAEGKRAASFGLDATPYNEMAGSYLDKAASACAGAAQ